MTVKARRGVVAHAGPLDSTEKPPLSRLGPVPPGAVLSRFDLAIHGHQLGYLDTVNRTRLRCGLPSEGGG